MIAAECHSDDRIAAATFDATTFFASATVAEIQQLAACDWEGDYPADAVAYRLAEENEDIAFVLRYATVVPGMGFECRVAEADARRWLSTNRPDVLLPTNDRDHDA
jgi:hypothetical protein